jgi:hypothetical protein
VLAGQPANQLDSAAGLAEGAFDGPSPCSTLWTSDENCSQSMTAASRSAIEAEPPSAINACKASNCQNLWTDGPVVLSVMGRPESAFDVGEKVVFDA